MTTRQVGMRAVMHLKSSRMLNEVSLLLSAVFNDDMTLKDLEFSYLKTNLSRKFRHLQMCWRFVGGGTDFCLLSRANVTYVFDAEVAVVVVDTMRIRDTAGCLAKNRSFSESFKNTAFNLSRENLPARYQLIKVWYVHRTKIFADLLPVKEAGEDRGVSELAHGMSLSNQLVCVIQTKDNGAPI